MLAYALARSSTAPAAVSRGVRRLLRQWVEQPRRRAELAEALRLEARRFYLALPTHIA